MMWSHLSWLCSLLYDVEPSFTVVFTSVRCGAIFHGCVHFCTDVEPSFTVVFTSV